MNGPWFAFFSGMKRIEMSLAEHLAPTSALMPSNRTSEMDEDEYAAAYEAGFLKTLRLIRFKGGSLDVAEEVAQAAWARGWQYRRQLQDASAVVAWVNTIAINLYRSTSRLGERFLELKENSVPTTLLRELELGGALTGCSFRETRLISMFYYEGYSTLEIAEKESLCPSTVRVRLMRIRRKLREKLT